MQGESEKADWSDTVIDLRPKDFVINVVEIEPPDDPRPPGAPRSPPPPLPGSYPSWGFLDRPWLR